jgi:hypothetical protein
LVVQGAPSVKLVQNDAGEQIWSPCCVVWQQPLWQSEFAWQLSAQRPPLPKSTQ